MYCSAHRSSRASQGFTLVEIVVVSAILLTLTAVLIPVVDGAVEKGHQGDCISHQRQIALNILAYAQDNNGKLPIPSEWVSATGLPPDSPLFDCPSNTHAGTQQEPDYGFNAFLFTEDGNRNKLPVSMDKITTPNTVEMTTDIKNPTGASTGNYWIDSFMNPFPHSYTMPGYASFSGTARHGAGVIASFLDGHVALLEGRAMGTAGASQYNIPPGYGRVYLDFSKVRDADDAKTAMQTFVAFAAGWMKPGGNYNAAKQTWELMGSDWANNHLITSAEGSIYDKNCAFNGAPHYAMLSITFSSSPDAIIKGGNVQDWSGAGSLPPDPDPNPVTNQNNRMDGAFTSMYFMDLNLHKFQGGSLKCISDQPIYANYTPRTWVDLTPPVRGAIVDLPTDVTDFKIDAMISYRKAEIVPFPTDPTNPNGWVLTGNYATGVNLYSNINLLLSSGLGTPYLEYNGPFIANEYTAGHYGKALIWVAQGSADIKKIYWAPSL